MRLPDVVEPGVEWTATLIGVTPSEATCVLRDLETGAESYLDSERRDGEVAVPVTLPSPGLYRLSVTSGAGAQVSQLVMGTEPQETS
jgi:hypothetical protein